VSIELPPRWTKLRFHPTQHAYINSPHRFNTVPAGRRSGKTELAKRKVVRRALAAATKWTPRFFCAAPTRDQAKRIFWNDLKALSPRHLIAQTPSESDLMIQYLNGAQLWVIGLDKPQRMEGQPWDGGIIDEIADTKESAWPENVRPSLSDRLGWCDLIGVPEGRNHYYQLDRSAKARMKASGAASDWGSYSWASRDILPASEIAAAMQDLDELTFAQEYEASFVNFEGRAYYSFLEADNTAPLVYDENATLNLCFDFNVEPGVCAYIQEQVLPGQYELAANGVKLLDHPITGTGIIGEVHIPRNSNTPAVCKRIIKDYGSHKGRVVCYGDATGGSRGTAKVEGSDWDLIERDLRPKFGNRLSFNVKSANPKERARLNAMNSRTKSSAGIIRLMVDGAKAPQTVLDFEGVRLLKGGSGEIDKDATPKLTHVTDAIGYYVEHEFPTADNFVRRVEVGGV